MIHYENECCGCAVPAYPCRGSSCPNRNVPHFYCDDCGNEFDPKELYDVEDQMLCEKCTLLQYSTVAQRLKEGAYEMDSY